MTRGISASSLTAAVSLADVLPSSWTMSSDAILSNGRSSALIKYSFPISTGQAFLTDTDNSAHHLEKFLFSFELVGGHFAPTFSDNYYIVAFGAVSTTTLANAMCEDVAIMPFKTSGIHTVSYMNWLCSSTSDTDDNGKSPDTFTTFISDSGGTLNTAGCQLKQHLRHIVPM